MVWPLGIVAQATTTGDELITARCDLDLCARYKDTLFDFARYRRKCVHAARALGVSNWTIMFRHMLPNAMVATLTMLPFIVTGTIGTLASLDFLGFGLPSSAPSLGELTLQAKENLQAPWLAFTAFFTFAIMLSLLVFIFEGVRDAFDPRKTFQ
mgnify:CR=1 FL=1